MNIYKPCDIRGDAASELSPSLYYRWGFCLGRKIGPGTGFVVGGDVRLTTPKFLESLSRGLVDTGALVLNLGIVPTPLVYFAKRYWKAGGCAVVTASHGPPNMNGLKWMLGKLPPREDDVRTLQREAEKFNHETTESIRGLEENVDLSAEYMHWLKESWVADRHIGNLYVVLDPGNGCWSGRAAPYLREVFPHVRFSAIHDQADGTFSERNPDSARPEHLHRLAENVLNENADLGIAFDGDGDRVAFVDPEGTPLTAEEATWVLLHSLAHHLGEQRFVYDIKFSDRIPQAAGELGAVPIAERSGHAFIRTRMIKENALFGAEISGHYFYRDLEGGDDGLFTACRMLAHLGEGGKSLAELRKGCPPVFMTPDLRVAPPEGDRDRVIRHVKEAFGERPQSLVDGVRIGFPDGWALVRSSVTEETLTFRFEGADEAGLERIVSEFSKALPEIEDELRTQFTQSKGTERNYE